jgi:hypothetical protein
VEADDARAATAWPLRVSERPRRTDLPSVEELDALRALEATQGRAA